jgi:hypothetical protein
MPMMSMRNGRRRESDVEHKPVKSSNIASVAYDPNSAIMEVKFANGGLYRMKEVMPTDHHALVHAASIGSHFAAHIRGKFPTEKVS